MSDKGLSSLTAASALDGTEFLYGLQGGNSRKFTVVAVADFVTARDNAWSGANTFPQTGIKFASGADQWELRARTLSSSTIGGAAYFRPTTNNRSAALDVMPKGTGGDATGAAWIHVLDRDLGDAGANWQAAVLACLNTGEVRMGSHCGGTGTYQPVKIGGTFVYFQSQTYGSPDQYGYFRDTGFYLGRSGTEYAAFGLTAATLRSAYNLKWTSGIDVSAGSVDLGITRNASDGSLEINSGTPGTFRDLSVRNISSQGGTFKTDTNVWVNNGTSLAYFIGSLGTALSADGAGIAAFRQGTQAHNVRIYYTHTDGSNYQRGALNTGSDYCELAAETAGTGADDLDVRLTPAGTGKVRFGTHSALAAETVSGYVTVKDAGGTSRKLAVVS